MSKLNGKKAIVTGAAMGIGFETAKLLLAEGCDVTVWDMNAQALKKAEKELKAAGKGKVFCEVCDVTDFKKAQKLVAKAGKDMGRIDILVNNAGIERHGRYGEKPFRDWELVININLNALMFLTHAVLPLMYKRNEGYIVNISSAAGMLGVADLSAYCASKWGVWGFTEALRHEIRADKRNIHVASIHPIFLKVGLFAGGRLNWFGEMLVPRIKTHDRVAKAIVYKAIKKKRNTVKIPVTLQLGLIARAILPDSVFTVVGSLLFGVGKSMNEWVGRGDSKPASGGAGRKK
jgi:all-trans-retinol dehydrogenase (NAD+)